MIRPEEALTILKDVTPLGFEKRLLPEALGHALFEDIIADRDIPPLDRSAMDGFAVRAEDLENIPCELKLAGEIAAGSPLCPKVNPGECIRIMTGANIPPGADTVVMLEFATEDGDYVKFKAPVKNGSNILRQGEDAGNGEVLLEKGVFLGPLQIGVCATVGKSEVRVFRRPKVGIICTGEELKGFDSPVRPHELRNSNGPALCAALETLGYPIVKHLIVRDRVEDLVSELNPLAEDADVILLTGGVSKGKYDFVREAVERIGAKIQFHGVAMKPGKPLLCASLDGRASRENNMNIPAPKRYIFGLSGNPLSAMTGFYEFALPTLRRLSGIHPDDCRPSFFLPVSARVKSKGGRTHFMLARLESGRSGLAVCPVKSQSSSDLVAGGRSDGVIVIPPEVTEFVQGAVVEFHSWKPLL